MLIVFGVILLIPGLAQRVQAPLSRLARFGPKTRGDGFWTGMGVGAALGFVCAPCAGPILGAVIFVSSSTGPTVRVTVIAVCYSLGLGAVMLVGMLRGVGAQYLIDPDAFDMSAARHTCAQFVRRAFAAPRKRVRTKE